MNNIDSINKGHPSMHISQISEAVLETTWAVIPTMRGNTLSRIIMYTHYAIYWVSMIFLCALNFVIKASNNQWLVWGLKKNYWLLRWMRAVHALLPYFTRFFLIISAFVEFLSYFFFQFVDGCKFRTSLGTRLIV